MLNIRFVNITPLTRITADSDYDVIVTVNNRVICSAKVTGHDRESGWIELLKLFIKQNPLLEELVRGEK